MTDSQRAASQFVEVNDNEVKIVNKSLLDKTRKLVAVIGPTGNIDPSTLFGNLDSSIRRRKKYYVQHSLPHCIWYEKHFL